MEQLVSSQRKFFNTHETIDTHFRIRQLSRIKDILKSNEAELFEAIHADFKKSSYETYISELGLIYHEINVACRKLKKWSQIQRVRTNIMNLPAKSYTVPVPLGVVLVIGSWNFPYMLTLIPALSALAAGNTVILKPSELPANASRVLARLINENFDPRYFKVVEGGVEETTELIQQKFDKVFFTGSVQVGKIIYQAAAKNLTPVTLELGGKNPAIFTESCKLKISVKRLIWAKFLNAGQTCVAPDYVLVPKYLLADFLELAVSEIKKSRFAFENSNYVQIINDRHMERLIGLIDPERIHFGGRYDREGRHIEPTLLTGISFDDPIMEDEIFGPILPIIAYDDLNDALSRVKSLPDPLACYIYTGDKEIKKKVLKEVSFGGGAVNDSVMHFINSNLPFGGIGTSGIGSYHGKQGFETFTHYKSILERPTWFEPNIKYFPHTKNKLRLIKRLIE